MYCSSCGVAIAQGLSYCNHCGAKLGAAKSDSVSKSPEVKPELLVSAMVGGFILGIAAITAMMAVMKAILDLNVGQILAFTLLSFLVLLIIEGVIIRLLFRRKRGAEQASDTVLLQGPATKELDEAQARVLPEAVPSVTEHTTRAFEPIYSERTSK